MTVRVKIPEGTQLTWEFARDNIDATVRTEEGMTVYTWQRDHIPMVEAEEHQLPLGRHTPVLYFTTVGYDVLSHHVLGSADDAPLPAPAMAEVERVQSERLSPLERALALRRWVATRIGGMNGPLDILGFQARPPVETAESNVGSTIDRAVLLARMCRAAGIEATPVLFSHDVIDTGMRISSEREAGSRIDHIRTSPRPAIPCLHLYPHAAVVCMGIGPGNMLVLDPVHAEQAGPFPKYYRGYYLPLDGNNPEPKRYGSGELRTTVSTTSDWTLSPDLTVSGRTRVSVDGVSSMVFSPESFGKKAASVLTRAGQGMKTEADDVETQPHGQTVCELVVTSRSPLDAHGGFFEFNIPHAPGGITELSLPLGDASRSTPVDLPGPLQESNRMVLHLPKGVRAVGVPAAVEISNGIGSVKSVIAADAHDVEITRIIIIDVPLVMPESYGDLQELLRAWRSPSHTVFLLQRK